MGFFDSIIEQTIDLLKRDGELSSCRILKAHPDCFHQSPLSRVTVTVSLGASVGGRRGGVGNGLQPVR